MTRFLLENVYGSTSSDDASETLTDQNDTLASYIPGMYMVRRVNGRDDIRFDYYRYTKPDKKHEKRTHSSSRGLIQIDLIETSSSGSDIKQFQSVLDSEQLKSEIADSDNQLISASLSYQKIAVDSKVQPVTELIPGGCLHSEDVGAATLISDQVFIDRLASPANFSVALDGPLAEKLWSLFEEGDVKLELSMTWQLYGEESGKPFRQMITQTIPVLTSMAAQRNCFHKYEVWADLHHDFTELQVQCFSFLMRNSEGLEKIEVLAGFDEEGQKVTHKSVTFDKQDPSSTKVITFPSLNDDDDEIRSFVIKTVYHFEDGSVNESAWQPYALRYFDATYRHTD